MMVIMRMPARMQALGFGLSFWAIFAVVYPTVKVLEACEHGISFLHARMKS